MNTAFMICVLVIMLISLCPSIGEINLKFVEIVSDFDVNILVIPVANYFKQVVPHTMTKTGVIVKARMFIPWAAKGLRKICI